jgi:predicted RNA-binding protein with PUA-like domain
MARWLLKTEPSEYSWADLQRDTKTTWDGIRNALALKHIRAMHKGDLAFIYHTGSERAIVGIAEITTAPRNGAVQIKPKKILAHPVTHDMIKSDKAFAGWDLLRISRLSVMPVPEPMWKRIEDLATKAKL